MYDELDDELLLDGIQEIERFDLFKVHLLNESVDYIRFLSCCKLHEILMIIYRPYLILQGNLHILTLIGFYSVGAVRQ